MGDSRYSPEDRLKLVKPAKIPLSNLVTLSKDMCPTSDKEKEEMKKDSVQKYSWTTTLHCYYCQTRHCNRC